jgi:flagellar protein FliS
MRQAMHAASAYRQTGVVGRVLEADPQQLVAQLYAGALERIALARTALAANDRARKAEALNAAAQIVEGLRLALDRRAGGALAERLEALYDYIGVRLTQANAGDDGAALDECEALLARIAGAWNQIAAPRQGAAR